MKTNTHPEYLEATVRCGCGHTWKTRSTKADLRLDICSKCHPFFTGEQRYIDTGGQIDKFMRRMKRGGTDAGAAAPASAPAEEAAAPVPAATE